MKQGKICVKHPELNGLRTNSHACAGCKREKDLLRKRTIGITRNREKARAYNQNLKEKVFGQYGKACSLCGFDNIDALTIDHVNNDGAEHRRRLTGSRHSGGTLTYRWLVKNDFPAGFRTLCQNCNVIEYKKYARSKHL